MTPSVDIITTSLPAAKKRDWHSPRTCLLSRKVQQHTQSLNDNSTHTICPHTLAIYVNPDSKSLTAISCLPHLTYRWTGPAHQSHRSSGIFHWSCLCTVAGHQDRTICPLCFGETLMHMLALGMAMLACCIYCRGVRKERGSTNLLQLNTLNAVQLCRSKLLPVSVTLPMVILVVLYSSQDLQHKLEPLSFLYALNAACCTCQV